MAKRFSTAKIRGVVNMGKESEESMDEALHLVVLVDEACPTWLAIAVRDVLVPERDAHVDVALLGSSYPVLGIDVAVIVAGGSEELVRNAIRMFAAQRHYVVVVAETSLDIPDTQLPAKLSQFVTVVVGSEKPQLYEKFSAALLDSTDKHVSCAANFGFCRNAATARLVSKCAARNAVMGVAGFVPGAGMPLMTMNQVNLSFDMAATYGKGLSLGRVPEVVFVVAAGIVYRGIGRMLLRRLPHVGHLLRIGLAYGGTLLTGRILSEHFIASLPPSDEVEVTTV